MSVKDNIFQNVDLVEGKGLAEARKQCQTSAEWLEAISRPEVIHSVARAGVPGAMTQLRADLSPEQWQDAMRTEYNGLNVWVSLVDPQTRQDLPFDRFREAVLGLNRDLFKCELIEMMEKGFQRPYAKWMVEMYEACGVNISQNVSLVERVERVNRLGGLWGADGANRPAGPSIP